MQPIRSDVLRAYLDRADYEWFVAHPTAEYRKRMYICGEDAAAGEARRVGVRSREPTHVIVFRPSIEAIRRVYICAEVDA